MIFIGKTKFSVFSPASGAWKATNGSRFKTQAEYKAYLFSDTRLEPRITIFTKYSLPQLELASKGHDVALLVSYSEFLPEKYENQLISAAAKYPFLILEKQELGKPHVSLESIAKDKLQTSNDPLQPFGIFRLDDDDILPADYFEQNAPYIKNEFIGMQISLGTGISAIYRDGKFFNARKCYHPMLSIGYMSVHQFGPDGTMTKFPAVNHTASDRHYPVIMDSRKLGYFWTRHTEQDTVLGLVETDEESRVSSLKRHMNTHPAVHDMEELKASFPVLEGNLTAASDASSTHQELLPIQRAVPSEGLHLKPERVGGEIKVSSDLVCDMSSVLRNALLSFIFVDSAGLRVAPESLDEHMHGQEISRSGNPSIGWFRYLGTKPGKNRTQMQFQLPEGIFVGAVRVVKWKRAATNITIQSLSVESRV